LTSLNISSNNIGAHWDSQQQKMISTPEGIFVVITTYFVPHCILYVAFAYVYIGPAAIADAIKDMKALIKLDSSSNYIGAEAGQEEDLQRICMARGIKLTK
jgi:hypothetical protein